MTAVENCSATRNVRENSLTFQPEFVVLLQEFLRA